MPLYEFSCSAGDRFETILPMSSSIREVPCRFCEQTAFRRVSAVGLSRVTGSAAALMDRTLASAESPDIVTSLPAGRHRPAAPVTRNPLHQKLPRP